MNSIGANTRPGSTRRLRIILILGLVASALAVTACSKSNQYHGYDLSGLMPDLAFTLTGENGKTVTAESTAGSIRAVFFGYTHCPDICPVTLSRLKAALQMLPEAQRDKVRVLFVSVDPRRDDAERLREYTSRFGPRFIGLTGTQEQLAALTKRYRVTYSYGEPNDKGFYIVSHSTGVYVFGPNGRLHLLLDQSLTAEQIAQDLGTLLNSLS